MLDRDYGYHNSTDKCTKNSKKDAGYAVPIPVVVSLVLKLELERKHFLLRQLSFPPFDVALFVFTVINCEHKEAFFMGLFTPKITPAQKQFVQMTIGQLHDSGRLVNTTVNPEVFFKRLNFIFDLLLRLMPYEKYGIFKPKNAPTKDYKKIEKNLEITVNDFIDRALEDNQKKMFVLKRPQAKTKRFIDFSCALISAFDCASQFWEGDRGFPHYTGPLFTERNYARVQAIWDEASNLDLPDEMTDSFIY